MGRYTGPKTKLCRRVSFMIFDNTGVEKAYLKRETVRYQRKLSEYGRRLQEKQKVMHAYGLREKQMRRLMDRARRAKGDTGHNFMVLLQQRLDNVVFSAGFAPTRPAARQLVSHGHVRVNGRKVDIPSCLVHAGDSITFRDKPGTAKLVNECIERKHGYDAPDWIAVAPEAMTAKIVRLPVAEDTRIPIDVQFVVEFYSR